MGQRKLPKTNSVANPVTIRCLCCNEEYTVDDYYNSDSLQYRATGKLPYCKNCIDKIYQKYIEDFKKISCREPEKKAVQRLCMTFDLYYSDKLYDDALSNYEKNKEKSKNESRFIVFYFRQVKLYQYRKKDYFSTIDANYKELKSQEQLFSVFNGTDEQKEKTLSKAERFFGAGLPDENDYLFLQEQYDDWTSRHECKTKSQEEVFKAICFNRLKAYKANLLGEDTKDLDRTFKDLLDTGKLQPKQNKDSMIADKRSFGELMETWENVIKKPVPKPTGHLADIDHIGELDGFMRGHTCRAIGLPNFYSETYSKLMKKFTVNKPEYENDYDSEAVFDNLFSEAIDKSTSDE